MGAFVFLSLAIPFTLESKLVNAPNSMTYQDYLKTDYWKAVSDAVKKRADYRCQLCNSQHDLCAHHRTYDHRGQELDHLSDLTCLCRRCHEIFHGKTEPKTNKPVLGDVDSLMPQGDAIRLNGKLLKLCATPAGGWTNFTMSALGECRNNKGWRQRLLGKIVSRDAFRLALQGRFITGSKKKSVLINYP